MAGFGVARVAIDSPLPQLDRLFDYQVAEPISESIRVGARVRVPFGRGASLSDGYVIELVEKSLGTTTPIFIGCLQRCHRVDFELGSKDPIGRGQIGCRRSSFLLV
jgi:hypothetical protein